MVSAISFSYKIPHIYYAALFERKHEALETALTSCGKGLDGGGCQGLTAADKHFSPGSTLETHEFQSGS